MAEGTQKPRGFVLFLRHSFLRSFFRRRCCLGNFGLWTLDFGLPRLPAFMDPKPVGRVAANRCLKGLVHIEHDLFGGSALAILFGGNFVAELDSPLGQSGAVADSRVERRFVAQGKNRWRSSGRTDLAEEWNPYSADARMLVGEQSQDQSLAAHGLTQGFAFAAALEEKTAGASPQFRKQFV